MLKFYFEIRGNLPMAGFEYYLCCNCYMARTQMFPLSEDMVHLLAPTNVPELISIVIETRHVTSVLDSVQLANTAQINTTAQ